jgi:hypothetical protein
LGERALAVPLARTLQLFDDRGDIMRFTRFIPGAFALASLSTLAAGCVGSARGGVYADSGYAGQPAYDDGYAESEYYTDYAPPPPRETVVYNRPGYVWVTGRWARVGPRWNWRRGYWVRQRPGLVFAQPRWDRVGNRWVYRPGGWNRNPYAGRNIDQRDRVLDRRDRMLDRRDRRLDRRDERLDRRQDRLDDRFDNRPRARERFEDRQQRRPRDVREDQRQRRRDQRQEQRRNENREQRRGRPSDRENDEDQD